MTQNDKPSFHSVGMAVLTVSDTRTVETDKSGQYLCEQLQDLGHALIDYQIQPDEINKLQAVVKTWVNNEAISVILITGGTGITGRDVTPEAIEPLLSKAIPGFGELFRVLSYETIGTSTIQSRAFAGVAEETLVFGLPGSTGACKDAWTGILVHQLDNRTRPCNFIELLPRLGER
ncbi:molybdenum cofactor biosynthesis protein B [Temperatibacter marinus]|uniref:Molybdenum cofactor biosynthesis protein B n=1 Tax=Temperatibacter marinus TaxID=1456591 RepID=A0AA52H9D3_9PROT|nr:molybdenum cofactor biosynthesis protein B [Temperatibacter marinus]WND01565.1 molybdenum cofactor biosynthesis protein B [Temperatibacter marinus]